MNLLKVARAKKDLTVQQLADLLFVSRQAVDSWEKKKSKPSISKVMDLHRVLDIPLDDLMEFFDDKKEEK